MKEKEEKEYNYQTREFSDKVKNKINYQKVVNIKFPFKVYEKFKNFSVEHSSDCYWLAFEKLLDNYERDKFLEPKIIMLMQRDEDLKKVIQILESRIIKLENLEKESKSNKSVRKHFGNGEKNDK